MKTICRLRFSIPGDAKLFASSSEAGKCMEAGFRWIFRKGYPISIFKNNAESFSGENDQDLESRLGTTLVTEATMLQRWFPLSIKNLIRSSSHFLLQTFKQASGFCFWVFAIFCLAFTSSFLSLFHCWFFREGIHNHCRSCIVSSCTLGKFLCISFTNPFYRETVRPGTLAGILSNWWLSLGLRASLPHVQGFFFKSLPQPQLLSTGKWPRFALSQLPATWCSWLAPSSWRTWSGCSRGGGGREPRAEAVQSDCWSQRQGKHPYKWIT